MDEETGTKTGINWVKNGVKSERKNYSNYMVMNFFHELSHKSHLCLQEFCTMHAALNNGPTTYDQVQRAK